MADIKEIRDKILITSFMSLFVAAGAGMIWLGVDGLSESSSSANWPTATGRILYSGVEVDDSGEGTCHYAKIIYQYKVNQREYRNDDVELGGHPCSSSYAKKISSILTKGKVVDVYYDPANPKKSCLLARTNYISIVPIVIGLLFACAGFAFIYQIFHVYSEEKKKKAKGVIYYERQEGRGCFSLFLIFFVSVLTAGFVWWAIETIFIAPIALFLTWCLYSVLRSFFKKENWEAGIKDNVFWWKSPRLPKSHGEIPMDSIRRIKMDGGALKAHVFIGDDEKHVLIPFIGSAYGLKGVLEERYPQIEIDWKDSS